MGISQHEQANILNGANMQGMAQIPFGATAIVNGSYSNEMFDIKNKKCY